MKTTLTPEQRQEKLTQALGALDDLIVLQGKYVDTLRKYKLGLAQMQAKELAQMQKPAPTLTPSIRWVPNGRIQQAYSAAGTPRSKPNLTNVRNVTEVKNKGETV